MRMNFSSKVVVAMQLRQHDAQTLALDDLQALEYGGQTQRQLSTGVITGDAYLWDEVGHSRHTVHQTQLELIAQTKALLDEKLGSAQSVQTAFLHDGDL